MTFFQIKGTHRTGQKTEREVLRHQREYRSNFRFNLVTEFPRSIENQLEIEIRQREREIVIRTSPLECEISLAPAFPEFPTFRTTFYWMVNFSFCEFPV